MLGIGDKRLFGALLKALANHSHSRLLGILLILRLLRKVALAKSHTLAETKVFVEEGIASIEGLQLEYYEVVDDRTLQTVRAWDEAEGIVGCITVFCGEVRLIDNIRYK